jgi:HD superfamily phosphohydrolase
MKTLIKDCIYRYVGVPKICQEFIDTPEFQRLRRVKQLGVAHYTYPSAVHTRFEHSLGVMHLAGLAVDSIVHNSGQEISTQLKELVMLAGLLHDIGHMAYSHMFDDVAGSVKGLADEHEHRSLNILSTINRRKGGIIQSKDEHRVHKMILGDVHNDDPAWLYQIVNNKLCDVDVDKMDYLQRDAYHTGMPGFQPDYVIRQMTADKSGNLAFKKKAYSDVENIFITRKHMFTNVYYHKTTAKIDAIYRSTIGDAIGRLNSERIIYHFEDDFQAETYLRKEYPLVFALLDDRNINEAIELTKANIYTERQASYVTGCNDLETVMKRIIFV